MDLKQIKEKVANRILDFAERGPNELREQGHVATGNLVNSFEVDLDDGGTADLTVGIYAEDYALQVDTGQTALEIRQKGNRHILDIDDWLAVKKPNLPPPERESAARRIAAAHRKKGVPLPGAKAFSNNGRTTGWIEAAYEDSSAQNELEKDLRLSDVIGDEFERTLFKQI